MNRGVLGEGRLCGLVCNCSVGPGTLSDMGCLLFKVNLLTEDLPGQDCCGNYYAEIFLLKYTSYYFTAIKCNSSPAVVAWIVSALLSHSVDGTFWRSVDRIPLGEIYMV